MIKHIHYFKFKSLCNRLLWRLFYSRSFKFYGSDVNIFFPEYIVGEEYITIESSVYIGYRASIIVLRENEITPNLTIEKGTKIRRLSHIVCLKEVVIGKNVLIADKVFIADNIHGYSDPAVPILNQPLKAISSVYIGDGSCIGENVCIIGARVGRNCVVGANSVVVNDIPDYSVAVGCPAKVIKSYDFTCRQWVSVT